MGRRDELHEMLTAIAGTRNVYFQPPEGFKMHYPCIVYERDKIESSHASNLPYMHHNRYSVTAIDNDPESAIPNRIAELPLCQHDRSFVSDNLYHNVFNIYY